MKKNPTIQQAPDLRSVMTPKELAKKAKLQAPNIPLPAPKKNPALRYFLKVQKPGGPAMTFNGHNFSNNGVDVPHAFSRASTAKSQAKALLRRFPVLKDYKMWIMSKFTTEDTGGPSRRTRTLLRGGSKMNPHRRNKHPTKWRDAQLDQAAKKLEDFTGHPVQHLESAYSRSSQKTGLIIGELDLVGYRATRDGKLERYGHHFKKNSRPLLAVTSDGKQLHIVGGQYEFTEAGIEDR
jgi:hypothetical protein